MSVAPEHPAAHWLLGRVFQAQRRFRLAVHHARVSATYLRHLPLAQRLAVIHGLISIGDYRAAIEELSTVPKDEGLRPSLVAEIASQLAQLDEHREVREWLDYFLERMPHESRLWYFSGNNWKYRGDFEKAVNAYGHSIRLQPDNPYPYLALASIGVRQGAEARIDALERRIRATTEQGSKGVLGYALFKEFDGIGDVDRAWAALREAMQIKKQMARHEARSDELIFEHLGHGARAISERKMQERQTDCLPIFVVGMPRTGTTLLERILGNHPLVAACGELSELRMQFKWETDYYCPGFLDVEAARKAASVDLDSLGRGYIDRVRWRAGGKRWLVDKQPANYLYAHLILKALPEAKMICLRRDAMDSCFGNLKEYFSQGYYEYSYDISDVAVHYRCFSRWADMLSAEFPQQFLSVSYENLVCEPHSQSLRIQEFCGLPVGTGMANIERNMSAVSTASSVQVREPIHTRRISGWKKYATHLGPLRTKLNEMGCI